MIKKIFYFLLALFAIGGFAVLALLSWLPTDKEIKGCLVTRMYQVSLCPTSKDYVPLRQISAYLQKTIIMTEDSSFYSHQGFDWEAIEKNAREGWEKGVFKRGGSTITQQLAKNMFLTKDRTFIRKGLEALITERIEKALTKKELYERYLNVVEFGKEVYGVKAAAQYYFKKKPAELSVVESAFLAMVLPNPIKYSKSFYRKELTPFARKRLRNIVEDLYRYKRITEDEYLLGKDELASFLRPAAPAPSEDSLENPPESEFLESEDSSEEDSLF